MKPLNKDQYIELFGSASLLCVGVGAIAIDWRWGLITVGGLLAALTVWGVKR